MTDNQATKTSGKDSQVPLHEKYSKEQMLELQLKKERIARQRLQNRVQQQQHELFKQAHPKPALAIAPIEKQSKKARKHTFNIIVSQVSPQPDGNIHVTAGYKLLGYVVMKVKTEEPLYMSALSLSLKRTENVMLSDVDGAQKKKVLKSMMFPVSQHFESAPNQPSSKGFYSWSKGFYQFPFAIETSTDFLPTYLYKQNEPYFETAERSYHLEIHYRKSVSDNEPWHLCHKTPIYIHQFRKQPEIMQYSQGQKHVNQKNSKFLLCKGSVHSSMTLLEQKNVYFMCYHSIPLRFEIDNQSNFTIKKVVLRLCQELIYRTSTKGNGAVMKTHILWARDMTDNLCLPLPKQSLRSVEKVVIPLDSPAIAPTAVKQQKSLFYFSHYIELIIRTPKKVSDISLKVPLTICEPPIEHLAQAIYNRSIAKQKAIQAHKEQKIGPTQPKEQEPQAEEEGSEESQ